MILKHIHTVWQKYHLNHTNESVKTNNVFALFGESIGQLGLSGWSRRGYCSRNGDRFTGLEAIIAFVEDLASSGSEQAEFVFN